MTVKNQFWLIKSEVNAFSWNDLQIMPNQQIHWDGIRNYQARNYMLQMSVDDQLFFYHSSCKTPEIVGIVKVVRKAYPDITALDLSSKYYDPKSSSTNPRWFMVDLKIQRPLSRSISLLELKTYYHQLPQLPLLKKGSRLSIMPVLPSDWEFILTLENQ